MRPSRNQCIKNSVTSWTQQRSSECSRADPLFLVLVRGSSSCQSDTVRSTDVTGASIKSVGLYGKFNVLPSVCSWTKPRQSRQKSLHIIHLCWIVASGGQSGRLWLGVPAQTAVGECRCVLAALPDLSTDFSARWCVCETT